MKYENQFANFNSAVLSNVNRGTQQSVVIRGSTLSGSNINRSNVTSQSNLGTTQDIDRSSVILNDISAIDAELNSIYQTIDDAKNKLLASYNSIKSSIESSDAMSSSDPRKMTASQRINQVNNMNSIWSSYQSVASTFQNRIDSLLAKRKVLEDQLVALGRPVPRRPNMNIEGRGTATLLDTANKIADNVNNAIGNVFSGGFGGGGFGGGGGTDTGEDSGASQSFFQKNKLAILALGGVVGYLLIKR